MADSEMIDQGGPFTHLDELVRFANSFRPEDSTTPQLLDLRCGTGTLIRAFAPHGWEAVGVDGSIDLTDAAARKQPESMRADFMLASPETEIDLRDRQFDLIVAFDDLAEVLLEPRHFKGLLEFAFDLLRPGGHLLFQVERTTAFSSTDARIDAVVGCGFESAWRASFADLSRSIPDEVDHMGTRDIFVAKKGLAGQTPKTQCF